jgi:hypothetical protein
LNLEIKELKASIEAGHAQIQAAQETIMQLTEQDGRSKERVAEAKVNIYHVYPDRNLEFFPNTLSGFIVTSNMSCVSILQTIEGCEGGLSCIWINSIVIIVILNVKKWTNQF